MTKKEAEKQKKEEERQKLREQRLEQLKHIELMEPELEDLIKENVEAFKGDLRVLQSALGALMIGKLFGWRLLRLVLAPISYRKYQKILGIKFRDYCPDRGPLASKSLGLKMVDYLGEFWRLAEGMIPAKGKEKVE